jgi:hypothetical protein
MEVQASLIVTEHELKAILQQRCKFEEKIGFEFDLVLCSLVGCVFS